MVKVEISYWKWNKRRLYSGADKSLARPKKTQSNVSVRMVWMSFGALPCRGGKKTWWQLASRCCWNRVRPCHASELVSFLVGLRTYQHPGIWKWNVRLLSARIINVIILIFMFIPWIMYHKYFLYANICTNKGCRFILKPLRHVSLSIRHLAVVLAKVMNSYSDKIQYTVYSRI